ncbi:MAG: phosphoribosyltransferase family protein [Myxococcota bacterium]
MNESFEKFLNALWPQKCLACDQLVNLETFCQFCEASIRPADAAAVFMFSGAIRTAIQQAKFMPNESKARRLIAYASQHTASEYASLEGIVFVPIHWRRRIHRGFDLSALFAIMLSKQLGIPVRDWLRNIRFDKALTLAKSREERIKLTQGRYALRRRRSSSRVLLVDDVTTTGATLEAAKSALTAAGHEVHCYTLAKTPARGKVDT